MQGECKEAGGHAEREGPLHSKSGLLCMLLALGILELISAVEFCVRLEDCTSTAGWAVACGAVPTALVAVVLLAHLKGLCVDEMEIGMPWVCAFLIAWWACGAVFLTFHTPFLFTGNGYFATWGCVVVSAQLAIVYNSHVQHVKQAKAKAKSLALEQRACACLLGTSTIELIAALVHCIVSDEDCDGAHGWAVAVGVISMVASGCCLVLSLSSTALRGAPIISVLLSVWWALGVAVLTYDKPFKDTGNGYFATWASLAVSVWFVETTGGYRNAWQICVRNVMGGVASSPPGGAGATEYEFNGVKPVR